MFHLFGHFPSFLMSCCWSRMIIFLSAVDTKSDRLYFSWASWSGTEGVTFKIINYWFYMNESLETGRMRLLKLTGCDLLGGKRHFVGFEDLWLNTRTDVVLKSVSLKKSGPPLPNLYKQICAYKSADEGPSLSLGTLVATQCANATS